MKKTDRRILKTKGQLKDSLIHLMKEKPITKISVREISDYADMNRGTFYLHYKDIHDMVEKIEDEIFQEFYDVLNAKELSKLENKPFLVLENVFVYLADNFELVSALLGPHGDIAFLERLKLLVKEKCFEVWDVLYDYKKNQYYEAMSSFIVAGYIGLVKNWIDNGMKETPKEMAALINDFLLNGISALN